MKIGVVCSSDERFSFFQRLVREHATYRVQLEELETSRERGLFDWVFIDGLDYSNAQPGAVNPASKSFIFATAGQPMRPCVIQYDDSGHIRLQCARQAEAKCRAEKGIQSNGTSTLVFQHAVAEEE